MNGTFSRIKMKDSETHGDYTVRVHSLDVTPPELFCRPQGRLLFARLFFFPVLFQNFHAFFELVEMTGINVLEYLFAILVENNGQSFFRVQP